jgi:hypothetical protein
MQHLKSDRTQANTALRAGALLALLLMPILLYGQRADCPQEPTPPPADPGPTPVVAEPPALFVVDKDTNIGSGIVHIKNPGNSDAALNLRVTDFKSAITCVTMGTVPTLSAADPASKPGLDSNTLKGQSEINVKIDIAKLWEFGESTGELYQGNHHLATLKAGKFRVPFAVKSAAGPGEDDGLFYFGQEGSISLRNDDAMTYPVNWSLMVDGRVIQSGKEPLVLRQGDNLLKMRFGNELFNWPASGTLQDDVEHAKLVLHLAPAPGVQDVSLKDTTIPLKLRLRYFSSGWQQGWNLFWIVLSLLAGAAISIAMNIGIPNQTKRNKIHEKLHELSKRINSLGPGADSSAVTFLRVERSRLETQLHELYWFSPNLSAELPLIEAAIDLLNGRVTVVSGVRDIQAALHDACSVPPSVTDSALAAYRKTLTQADRPDLCAADVAALQAANAALLQRIASLCQGQADMDLENAITARERALKASTPQDRQTDPIWKVFFPDLEAIFIAVAANAGTDITPDQYFTRDLATLITQACAGYAAHRKLLSNTARVDAAEQDAAKARGFLALQTYPGLVQARSVFECIRESVSINQVLDALKSSPPKAEIIFTPSTPSTHELVWLQVRFLDPTLNIDAVRQQLTFKWNLGRGKYGWIVAHYFTQPFDKKKQKATEPKSDHGEANVANFQQNHKELNVADAQQNHVEVEFLDSQQNPVQDANGKHVKLAADIPVQIRRREDHVRVELLRTGLALLVALLGLIVTAQEKIANLQLVPAILAVVTIGISADAIKNLLSK